MSSFAAKVDAPHGAVHGRAADRAPHAGKRRAFDEALHLSMDDDEERGAADATGDEGASSGHVQDARKSRRKAKSDVVGAGTVIAPEGAPRPESMSVPPGPEEGAVRPASAGEAVGMGAVEEDVSANAIPSAGSKATSKAPSDAGPGSGADARGSAKPSAPAPPTADPGARVETEEKGGADAQAHASSNAGGDAREVHRAERTRAAASRPEPASKAVGRDVVGARGPAPSVPASFAAGAMPRGEAATPGPRAGLSALPEAPAAGARALVAAGGTTGPHLAPAPVSPSPPARGASDVPARADEAEPIATATAPNLAPPSLPRAAEVLEPPVPAGVASEANASTSTSASTSANASATPTTTTLPNALASATPAASSASAAGVSATPSRAARSTSSAPSSPPNVPATATSVAAAEHDPAELDPRDLAPVASLMPLGTPSTLPPAAPAARPLASHAAASAAIAQASVLADAVEDAEPDAPLAPPAAAPAATAEGASPAPMGVPAAGPPATTTPATPAAHPDDAPSNVAAARARTRESLHTAAREAGDAYALRRGATGAVDLGESGRVAVRASAEGGLTRVHVEAERGPTARAIAESGAELVKELRDRATVVVSGPGTTASFTGDGGQRHGGGDRSAPYAGDATTGSGSGSSGSSSSGSRGGEGGERAREAFDGDVGGPTDRQPIVAGSRVRIVL